MGSIDRDGANLDGPPAPAAGSDSTPVQRVQWADQLYPGPAEKTSFTGEVDPIDSDWKRSARRFSSDAEGADYGEAILGQIRDSLPADEFRAARTYTKMPVINRILRSDNPGQLLDGMRRDFHSRKILIDLTRTRVPFVEDLVFARQHLPIESDDRLLVDSILNHPDPHDRLDEMMQHMYDYTALQDGLEAEPTFDAVATYIATMGRATDQELPERLTAIRAVSSIKFMTIDKHGTQLGDLDPRNLINTVQRERGHLSMCLGKNDYLNGYFGYRLEFDSVGAKGLWLGERSHHPSQRELILPCNSDYHITDAKLDPAGARFDRPLWVLRATVLART
jgi:hypothetical protein